MAGFSGAATTTAVTPPPLTGKPTITSSSLPSSYPSRYKRHNHLRHKLLKTLDPTRPEDLTRKNQTFSPKDPFQQHPDEEKNFSEMGLSGFGNDCLCCFDFRSVKEKEVDGRLMKLTKSLEGNYEKLPNVNVLRNESEGSDDGEEFGSLMFKKKFKYKSPSVDSGDTPKGFGNGAVRTDKVNDEGVSSVGSDNEPRNKLVDTELIA
nr:hypothetical protein [Tanacetum cinerariifolium]